MHVPPTPEVLVAVANVEGMNDGKTGACFIRSIDIIVVRPKHTQRHALQLKEVRAERGHLILGSRKGTDLRPAPIH